MGASAATGALQPRLQAAINEVYATSGIRLDLIGKAKTLTKFGKHTALGTTRALFRSRLNRRI